MPCIKKPIFRIYDYLVPYKISYIINDKFSKNQSIILTHLAHTPFIYQLELFFQQLIYFSKHL